MYLISLLTYRRRSTLHTQIYYAIYYEIYVCLFHHSTNITKEIQHQYRESHKLGTKTIVAYYRATVYSKDRQKN